MDGNTAFWKGRWSQLIIGMFCMALVANLQYAWTLFVAPMQVSMNLTALRKSLARLADFLAETQYSLHILAVDNMAEPRDFLSIFVPNFTLGSVDPSAFTKQGGPRTETIAIPAALVGQATNAAAGFDPTMISFQTTAP